MSWNGGGATVDQGALELLRGSSGGRMVQFPGEGELMIPKGPAVYENHTTRGMGSQLLNREED